MNIGDTVETVYGVGVIERFTDYSLGRYFDVRMSDGQLVKVFRNGLSPV